MIKKLRIKFVCVNMIIVLIMLAAILVTVLTKTQSGLENDSLRFMKEVAADPMRMILPGEMANSTRLPFFVVDISSDGEITGVGGGFFDLGDTESLEDIVSAAENSQEASGVLSQYSLRYYRVTERGTERIIFTDISSEISVMRGMVSQCLLIGAVSLIVFFGISLALSAWAIKPVGIAWKQQKQFVSDASHELKTPLTIISVNAEMLSDSEPGSSPGHGSIDNILAGTERMRSLVESLLELARADGGMPAKLMSQVDLSEVVSMSLLSFEAVFFEKDMSLTASVEPGISIRGNAEHLGQVVSILLDNACKYGSQGGEVTCSLKRSGARYCLLSVGDTGDEIPKGELKNIFRRFYRLDSARENNGSYGLGLSIAEAVAREHSGRIWAESENGVNTFFVRLPVKRRMPRLKDKM